MRDVDDALNEAASVLAVNPNTVRSWLQRGVLPSLAVADVEALRSALSPESNPEGQ